RICAHKLWPFNGPRSGPYVMHLLPTRAHANNSEANLSPLFDLPHTYIVCFTVPRDADNQSEQSPQLQRRHWGSRAHRMQMDQIVNCKLSSINQTFCAQGFDSKAEEERAK